MVTKRMRPVFVTYRLIGAKREPVMRSATIDFDAPICGEHSIRAMANKVKQMYTHEVDVEILHWREFE